MRWVGRRGRSPQVADSSGGEDTTSSAVSPSRSIATRSALRRYSVRSAETVAPEDAETSRVADFCLRLGDAMLANGAATVDVEASIIAVAETMGVHGAEVDITFTAITVTLDRGDGTFPLTRVRVVRQRNGDFGRLTMAHALVLRITSGELNRREALAPLAELETARPTYPRWLVALCWGLLAAAVTQLLGGGWVAAVVALVSSAFVDQVGRSLRRRGWPDFFLQLIGAFLATIVAVALTLVDLPVRPSLVVAGGIVVLLSGVAIVAALQDAITGFMVTAAGRTLEVVLLTGGIITGVGMGLFVARQFDLSLSVLPPQVVGFGDLPSRIVAAGVGAAAFAVAAQAPRRVLVPAGLIGAGAYSIYFLGMQVVAEPAPAAALAAVAVGFAAHVVANRLHAPPLVLVVPGTVMLLPGLTIVRGMLQFGEGATLGGVVELFTAVTIALALAAGAIMGEIIAEPIDSEVVRMGRRLVRGGMVGVAAGRRSRRGGTGVPGEADDDVVT